MRSTLVTGLATLAALIVAVAAEAQSLGTFRWQLQPYCNVITVTVVQEGPHYRINGTDDQCGAARRAGVVGLAFPNPDGSIGFGLTTVTTPGGSPVHIDARITLAGLSGTWSDGAGNTGTFAFTPGAGTGGTARPAAPTAIPQSVVLLGSGTAPSGNGARLLWHATKRAFRAGEAENGSWDEGSIGDHSAAFGSGTIASGAGAVAMGTNTAATGIRSTSMGLSTQAIGIASTAMGSGTTASGLGSTALGLTSRALGRASVAIGENTTASGGSSTAIGGDTTASGDYSFAGGYGTTAGPFSMAGGQNSSALGDTSLAFGLEASAAGVGSVVLGRTARTAATGSGSFMFADRSTSAPFQSNAPNEFGARFAGGFYLYTRHDLGTGVALAANGSSWAALSDVNVKENFRDVDGEDLLGKLARIPIREWNYKAQDVAVRHMGPTAQDFRAAFGLGDFALRINTIDADGVALAGVQALDTRTSALRAAVDELRRENDELRARLARLEAALGGK